MVNNMIFPYVMKGETTLTSFPKRPYPSFNAFPLGFEINIPN